MKILAKEIMVDAQGVRLTRMRIFAPQIAQKAQAGQFVVVMAKEEGERIPLTIVDKDTDSVTLIFQEAGFTTKFLGKLNTGDSLYAIVGPLGHATEIKNYGKVILVGGGVGIAEIYPVACALKEAGNRLTVILGARNKQLLILEQELREVSDSILIVTDDGSYGKKGFTTDILRELLSQDKYDLIYAVGPIPMMRKVSEESLKYGTRTIVSLNALMVDATGMCGCCRVTVKGQTRFSCVDGPEFDAHQVDWDELLKRSCIYQDKEQHICKLNKL